MSGADATGTGPRAEVARVAARAAALRHRVHADALDELAAAVAYHAFLALLPLLLLATAAAGLVLADGAARSAVTDAVVGAVPALELATLPGGPLDTALAGVAAARGALGLLGGGGLVVAGEAAAPALLGLLALTGVGVGAVAGGVRAALVPLLPGPLPGPTLTAVAAVAATGLDALVVAGLFRLLVPRAGTLRSHLAGAVVVAAGWGALRVLGGAFVGTRIAAAGAVWGALAGVVTVLVLLHLLARLLLVGALVSALRHERSTP